MWRIQVHSLLVSCVNSLCLLIHCLQAKSVRRMRKKARAAKYRSKRALNQLGADFVGAIRPESLRKNRFGLIVVDPRTNWIAFTPIRHKSQNVEKIREVITNLEAIFSKTVGQRLIYFFRSDNEPAWLSAPLREYLNSKHIQPLRPPPYCPSLNPNVERAVRRVASGLRALLLDVDPRTWCWAGEHFARCHNDSYINKFGMTPNEQLQRELLDGPVDPRWRDRHAPKDATSREQQVEKLPYKVFNCKWVHPETLGPDKKPVIAQSNLDKKS